MARFSLPFLLGLLLGAGSAFAQPIAFVQTQGGPGEDTVYSLTHHDDVLCAGGAFEATAHFGGTTLTAAGERDGFLACYEGDGALRWVRRVGAGSAADTVLAVVADEAGAVWAVGTFSGVALLDGGTHPDVALTSAGGTDVFVARYDAAGDLLWARAAGGPGDDAGRTLAIRPDSRAVVAGTFRETAQFGTTSLPSAGGSDAFAMALSREGEILWVSQGGGKHDDAAFTVAAVDGLGVVVGGTFRGIALFAPYGVPSAGGRDGFLVRYDASGEPAWVRAFGGPGDDALHTLATDGLTALYAGGTFTETLTLGGTTLTSSGGADLFLVRLTLDAAPIWALRGGGGSEDGTGRLTLSGGEVAFVATMTPPATLDTTAVVGYGGSDVVLGTLREDGTLEALAAYGGPEDDRGLALTRPTATATTGLAFGGRFAGTAAFGGESVTSAGGSDGFLALRLHAASDVYFVRASAPPGGDGRTWASAFSSLADALAAAPAEARALWIAEGTYDDGPFVLRDSLALYGGFDGTEAELDERNPEAHLTRLVGDPAEVVVRINFAEGVRLDGLRIGSGAVGVAIQESTAIIAGCDIHDNRNRYVGGGLHVQNSTLTIERTTIRNNTAWDDQFDGSHAEGGGLYAAGSTLLFRDVLFEANTAEANVCSHGCGSGGGAASFQDVEATFIRTDFLQNVSQYTGAFASLFGDAGRLTFIACRFISNRADGAFGSGRVSVFSGSHATFVNSYFEDNYADDGPVLQGDTLTVINATFVRNRQGEGHAHPGVLESTGPENVVRNSILWDNDGPEIGGGVPASVSFSLVEGGYGPGTAILNEPPLLDPDGTPSGASPVVDYGINSFLPADAWDLDQDGDTEEPVPLDLYGNARIALQAVDLGAVERQMAVALEAPPALPGLRLEGIHPNPASAEVRVRVRGAHSEPLTLQVFDVLGRCVRTLTVPAGAGSDYRVALDVRGLASGTYVLRLHAAEADQTAVASFTVLR